MLLDIQIQHLLKLNNARRKISATMATIQIQHLLKLNMDANEVRSVGRTSNSNTTLVKVKYYLRGVRC